MKRPICDFVKRYVEENAVRAHMPGHKGVSQMGFEAYDITEIEGADALYEAEGIIAESEANAASLFGTRASFYSTEGSSQCIRAMLYLALSAAPKGAERPFCLAGRNAHKTFLYAAALCDFDVQWLMADTDSVCSCPITAELLSHALSHCERKPFCVYVTSPDYLGGCLDIAALAEVCHRFGVPLLVDNAHGAYLKFLPGKRHPMDAGADLCCDSAHKTLPVLTGGAYLHIGKTAVQDYEKSAKQALAMFGSTSPSYLILQSLDNANVLLSESFPAELARCADRTETLKQRLKQRGFLLMGEEPNKLVLRVNGKETAAYLRRKGIHVEFADDGHLVMMMSPCNTEEDFVRIDRALKKPIPPVESENGVVWKEAERVMTIREAIFAPFEVVFVEKTLGRICAAPTVSCPPAVPIIISGERIHAQAIREMELNGIKEIAVVKQ